MDGEDEVPKDRQFHAMLPPSLRALVAAIAAVALTSGTVLSVDGNDALLNLLVRKGVLSQQDVADLKRELAASGPAQPVSVISAPAAQTGAPSPAGAISADAARCGLAFRIGVADFTPFGFVDFTSFYRSEATGSGYPTAFTSIPFSNGATGRMSETKFTAQNSRFGVRIDSMVDDTNVLGYVETDFLGNAPSNLGVSSNSDTLRMRCYFADLRSGPWEVLFGQGWNLLTPNRRGISPVPSDVFYTNNMDGSYQAGLTWGRQAQVRAVYHAGEGITLGLSVEDPDQYVGGAVLLPAAFQASEVDTGASTAQPNAFPDVTAKAAFDTTTVNSLPWHFEVAGLVRRFRTVTYSPASRSDTMAEGGGVSTAVCLGLDKGLTLVGTGFWSDGGGRYIGGLAPDFVVKAPDSAGAYGIGLVKATSAIIGLEYVAGPSDTVSAYRSNVGIGQRYDTMPGGGYVGYGYPGSPSTNTRTIDEYTLSNTYTLWRNPGYGALQLIAQLSYAQRTPWYVAPDAPAKADVRIAFLDLRYVLP